MHVKKKNIFAHVDGYSNYKTETQTEAEEVIC